MIAAIQPSRLPITQLHSIAVRYIVLRNITAERRDCLGDPSSAFVDAKSFRAVLTQFRVESRWR